MAITFSIGSFVIPNEAFYNGNLVQRSPTTLINQITATLGTLIGTPCEVTETGTVSYPVRSYIKLLPTNRRNVSYRNGAGVILYMESDTDINNSLEYSDNYIRDRGSLRVLNNSGGAITKGDAVYQTGFDATEQLPTIGLADSSAESTSTVLGVAVEDITDGSIGSVVTNGSFDLDTSSFSAINVPVYLGLLGALEATVGDIEVIVGRVLTIGTTGSISITTGAAGGGDVSGTGKQTIWIPAAAMKPTVTAGCATLASVETTAGNPDLVVLDFDASSDEHAQFQVAFPKQWNKGTVSYQAFWTLSASNTDGVAWALQGVAVSNDETIDVTYGTPIVVTDNNAGTSNDQLVTTESAALTIAGTPADDDMCYFQVFRDVDDAADDAAEDGRLIGIKLFFTNLRTTDD